ncbi:glycoside hydrolase family 3 protein [Cristinia sonorae]|uniref:beta-glucosidase n=1 Tax=Cristinia sonorae TaxID=1940300 RepID=A0A8K0UPK5_9AGAR|nr:glycoside hydrolase family 3 protein [Cristinia sonorae]
MRKILSIVSVAFFAGRTRTCFAQIDSPEWTVAYSKAKVAVQTLSLSDKVALTTGPCTGNIPAISTINFPGLCLEDSPLGVRGADKVSAFPAGINAAATFNRTLMRARGSAMAAEFRGKGIHVQLGPMMNLMRTPASGRAWEGFGGDPYLSGEGAYETIMGIQSQGVQAVAKHLINNEQEHSRDASSSNVDDRYNAYVHHQQHEIYLHPFLRSVQANVAAVMCSYINGTYACESNSTLNGLLKTELAFQGYWQATHTTAASVNSGLDMTMPGAPFLFSIFGESLVLAVQLMKTVAEERITDMATRIMAAWYLLGQDTGYPEVNFDSRDILGIFPASKHVDVQGDHAKLIRTIGAASTVLLKNAHNALPLKLPKSIAVIGSGAGSNPSGPNSCLLNACNNGVLAMGWGSGTAGFPYLVAPLDALTTKAKKDGTQVTSALSDFDLQAAARAASGKEVAFVFITADSGENGQTVEGNAGDRNNLQAWHGGDALVQAVAHVNPNTVVIVNAVGPIIVEAWIDNPNVTALVWSGLPGQEAGDSLVDILYGDCVPSGRLPYTIGKSINDYPAQVDYTSSKATVHINYTEGLFVDYRHFDMENITPRFEFGFGLSYTQFEYSTLVLMGSPAGGVSRSGYGSSLDPKLHEKAVTVAFTLKNTGAISGHEIPQLYIALPALTNSPPSILKGFDSVFLAAGEVRAVTFQLSRYDLSVWSVVRQRWEVPNGAIGVMVGPSSRNLPLKATISAAGAK